MIMMCIGPPQHDGDTERQKWNGFLLGFMVISIFGLPLTMVHAQTVSWGAVALSLFGTVALGAGILVFMFGDFQSAGDDLYARV